MRQIGSEEFDDGVSDVRTSRHSSRPAGAESEPTILLVGAEQSFHQAIAAALAQHGVYVETSPVNGVIETVVATAPDLIVLVGDAAADGGSGALASLHTSPHSSVVPVAILADDSALGERLRAFRHGAAAVIPRSASVDALAEQVAKLAREIPEREREALGNVGEATLNELVDALSKELRSGILSVRSGRGSDDEAVRIVLGGGRPLAQTIDEFVSRIRRHVVHAEPLQYEFDERAGGTIQLFGSDGQSLGEADDVEGLRVLLADPEAARADAIAQALREHKASVVVTDFEPSGQRFDRLRHLDPAILLIDEPALRGAGFRLVKRMRRDTRLRWASLLVVRWEDVWSEKDETPDVTRMLGTLATLAEPEQSLRERMTVGHPFDTRLEITGPARLLRALAAGPQTVRVTIHNPRLSVRVDLSQHLIAGARAQSADGMALEGAVALSALLVLGSGRVHVERIDEAELVNIMATVDVALSLGDSEASPIQPSMPAPSADDAGDDGMEMLSLPPPPKRKGGGLWALVLLSLVGVVLVAAVVVMVGSTEAPPPPLAAPAPVSAPATPAARAPATQPAEATKAEPAAAASASVPVVPASAPAPSAVPPEPVDPAAEQDPARRALSLEQSASVPSCEAVVGASWSLLNGDQPGRAQSEVFAGRRALVVGKLDEAQMAFCRAAVLDPQNPEAFVSLVRLFLMRRDPQQAKEWAERAARHHPEHTEIRNLFGDALARLGDIDRAVSLWLETVKIDAADTVAVRGVAYTYAAAGHRAVKGSDYAQANRLFRRAALLDPSNGTAAAGMARTLLNEEQYRAALAWAKRAAALEPRDAEVRLILGDAYDKVGDEKEAYEAWKLSYELDPRSSRASSRIQRIPPQDR